MRFFRRIAGMLGFGKEENHETNDDDEDNDDREVREERHHRRSTKGFSVKVPVPAERAHPGPVIVPCIFGDGGVQGLGWYPKRLRIDEDGDVAEEFFNEVLPQPLEDERVFPKFEMKCNTRPAKVRKQKIGGDGNIHHSVEYKGRLQWV